MLLFNANKIAIATILYKTNICKVHVYIILYVTCNSESGVGRFDSAPSDVVFNFELLNHVYN